MEPLSNQGLYESPTKTGSAKVVPMHFRNGTDLELSGTGMELPSKDAELIGVVSLLDQMPKHMKGTEASEYFPWSWKHVRSNLVPRIARYLKVSQSSLFDHGTLTEEGIRLLADYEKCCSTKLSVFVDGRRVDIRDRDVSDVPQSFYDWTQDVLKERRQSPPINSVAAPTMDAALVGNSADRNSSALTVGGADFDIDAFVEQQLSQMGGVEQGAMSQLETVEAELIEADEGFSDFNQNSRLLRQRQIAAQAVQDAANDAQLYEQTYQATDRRIQATRVQAKQPGKSQAGQSQAT